MRRVGYWFIQITAKGHLINILNKKQFLIFNFFKENCLLNKVFWCASVSAYGKKTFNFNMSGLVMFVKHFIGNLKKNCNFYKFISKYLKVTTTIKVFTSTY